MAKAVVAATGCEWDGLQIPLRSDPAPATVNFYHRPTRRWLVVPVDLDATTAEQLQDNIVTAIAGPGQFHKRGSMTLREKLHKIYDAIDAIEKRGRNKAQSYDYVRSADVTRAIRKQFSELRVYAEINFTFEGGPYTIARAKDKDAPFSAVNARCSIIFHDLDSEETISASGLGTGADTGDKAGYKAQTGALKYALKNAFLVPDEADPEADSSTDENTTGERIAPEEIPDYNDFRGTEAVRPAPKVPPAVRPPNVALAALASAGSSQPVPFTETQPLFGATSADVLSKTETAPAAAREPGDDTEADRLPTEDELTNYRKQFSKLGDDLSTEGKLTASRALPLNRKLLVFLLSTTKVPDAKNITRGQWDNFFARVAKVRQLGNGLVELAKLVNKTNGLDEQGKKITS